MKKSIGVVVPSLKSGGLERVASRLVNFWSGKDELEVFLFCLDDNEPFYTIHERVNLIINSGRCRRYGKVLFILKSFLWLIVNIRNNKVKYVCSLGEGYNSFNLICAKICGAKVIVSNRASPLSSLAGFRRWVNQYIYRIADGIIFQTKTAQDLLYKLYNVRSVVIGNPFELCTKNNMKDKLILNVGSFNGNKNQDLLLKYFSALHMDLFDWELYYIGDGSKKPAFENYLNETNLMTKVHLIGKDPNVNVWYERSSIFAFTSTSEGFPNALGEAMAHGCACISFDCVAGPSELIDDGVNGFLIPEGDHPLYVQRLKQLMEDEELRIRFGKNAIEKMKQFSIDKIAKQYLDFILES